MGFEGVGSLSAARSALRFRVWALGVLRGGGESPGPAREGAVRPAATEGVGRSAAGEGPQEPHAAAAANPGLAELKAGDDSALAGWRLFLGVERCALPLTRALDGSLSTGSRPRTSLPEELRGALSKRARFEQQRALSARAHLQRLEGMLDPEGSPAIVLKGGAPLAAGGEPLDLADVDVYLEPERALSLARRLEEAGALAPGTDASLDELHHAHFAPRVFEGAIAVEVHHTLEAFSESEAVWTRARPVEPGSSLHRLSPSHHLWHLLWHSAVHHPFRRGNLRDLLLTARALEECTPEDRADVRDRIEGHEISRALLAQLGMAEGLGRPVDLFHREAAASYLLVSLYGSRGWPEYFRADVTAAAFALTGERVDRRAFWRRMLGTPVGESAAGWLRALEDRLPTVGRELRRLLRIPRALAALALAAPVAAGAWWLTRRPPGPD